MPVPFKRTPGNGLPMHSSICSRPAIWAGAWKTPHQCQEYGSGGAFLGSAEQARGVRDFMVENGILRRDFVGDESAGGGKIDYWSLGGYADKVRVTPKWGLAHDLSKPPTTSLGTIDAHTIVRRLPVIMDPDSPPAPSGPTEEFAVHVTYDDFNIRMGIHDVSLQVPSWVMHAHFCTDTFTSSRSSIT